jgi:geranylgeranyl diphosphate synthase type I
MASDWMADVRARVDARLGAFFEHKRRAAAGVSEESVRLVDAIAGLTMRGGKRLRPAALHAAFLAVVPEDVPDDPGPTLDLGASLELLQTYLLVHDDWMDGDDERRGGPAVHAELGRHYGDAHLGASVAVLAGDLASAWSWELLCAAPWPPERLPEGLAAFRVMQEEVVLGQHLDLLGRGEVSLVQHLKTGSYTVRGPMTLGALLGNGGLREVSKLIRFGQPLGVAFQLRDDLLGTFGDPRTTGKPAGNDLRAGKRTALVAAAEAMLTEAERAPVTAVLGRAEATDAEIAAATECLTARGVRAHVEAEVAAHAAAAEEALEAGGFGPRGKARLRELMDLLLRREK